MSNRSAGHCIAAVADVFGALERDDPEKLRYPPRSSALPRLVGTAGEAVEHEPRRDAGTVEHIERVVPGITGVDDERQVEVDGQGDLGGEHVALGVAWRVVVVVVEPALADRHGAGAIEVDDRVDAVPGLVRMQTDGGVDVLVARRRSRRQRSTSPGRNRRRSSSSRRRARPRRPRRPRARSARRRDGSECRTTVDGGRGMAIGGQTLIRGNSGSPLVTGRPPG